MIFDAYKFVLKPLSPEDPWFKRKKSGGAMAVVGVEDPQHVVCPVMTAWSTMDAVMQRMATAGLILYCPGKKLTRQTCIDNGDVLGPLINAYGYSSAILLLNAFHF